MYRAKILRKDAKVVLKPATTIHARQVAQAVNMDFATQSQCTRVAMMAQHQVYLPKGGGEAEEQIAEGYFLYMDKIAIDPHGQSGESARDIKNERNSPRRDPQPFHALIVFDWNDVLFPCSALQKEVSLNPTAMPVLPSRLSGAVQQLERKVINLLATAQSFGSVLILAGCSQRFVRFTMKAYMPDLYTFVTERQINTVSAKTTFETMFPKDEFARKSRAFYKQVKLALAGRTPLRQSFKFVTVGSDRCEREAAHDLRHRIPLDCIKIIELSSKPTLSVVQAQIDKVASMLPEVVLSEEFCAQFVRDA